MLGAAVVGPCVAGTHVPLVSEAACSAVFAGQVHCEIEVLPRAAVAPVGQSMHELPPTVPESAINLFAGQRHEATPTLPAALSASRGHPAHMSACKHAPG